MSQQPAATFAELDRERARLKALLRRKHAAALARRPPSGEWSIIENVRHLLFAEQLHLGRFVSKHVEWNLAGMSGRTGKQYGHVGKTPVKDVEEVFEAWDAVHRPIRHAVRTADGDVQKALEGNLMHMRHHVGIIERLLRQAGD